MYSPESDKKLSYRRVTARCVLSVVILPRVYEHERSRRHRAAFIEWKELEQHLRQNTIIDAGLQAQITAERQRWRDVLDRISHTVKLCATQNLPLRGHREYLQQS